MRRRRRSPARRPRPPPPRRGPLRGPAFPAPPGPTRQGVRRPACGVRCQGLWPPPPWGTMDHMSLATGLDIRAISPNIGAEIRGLDLRRPLGDAVVAEVRAALCRHLVLFFPDQDLAPDVQAEFA